MTPIRDLVIKVIDEQCAKGIETYGEPLTVEGDNGSRDWLAEAMKEQVDYLFYTAKARVEHARQGQKLLATIGEQEDEITRLRAELADANETIAVRDSYIANYEHATKIERQESEAQLAAQREIAAMVCPLCGTGRAQ